MSKNIRIQPKTKTFFLSKPPSFSFSSSTFSTFGISPLLNRRRQQQSRLPIRENQLGFLPLLFLPSLFFASVPGKWGGGRREIHKFESQFAEKEEEGRKSFYQGKEGFHFDGLLPFPLLLLPFSPSSSLLPSLWTAFRRSRLKIWILFLSVSSPLSLKGEIENRPNRQ